MSDLTGFKSRIRVVAADLEKSLRARHGRVFIFHHNDTDGLTSGALLFKAFERMGVRARGYCLEKPYPMLLEFILREQVGEEGAVIVFADFASGMLPTIAALNCGKSDIFVLDHHALTFVSDSHLRLLNCLEFGVNGGRDCSASAICCEFVNALNPQNADLLPLGFLGALGDGFVDANGELTGLNREHYDAAEERGLATRKGRDYFMAGCELPAGQLVEQVNALGSYGYFAGGPDLAIKGLLEGFDERYQIAAQDHLARFRACFDAFLQKVVVNETAQLSWFELDDTFGPFGVKTVGLVCEKLLQNRRVSGDRYLAGFQKVPDRIPGLGPFHFSQVKVSMRVGDALRAEIAAGGMPGLDRILPAATGRVGGFVDACHPHAAATTIAPSDELRLIREIQKEIEQWRPAAP